MEKHDYNIRKRSLKAGMIENGVMPGESDEAYHERVQEEQHRGRRTRLIIVIILAVITAGCILGYKYYQNHYRFKSYEVKWTKELDEGKYSGYEEFGDNILKYSRDGVSCLDKKGNEIWNQTYDMDSPFVCVNGDYVAIADNGGYSICICNNDGNQGNVTTTLPISKVAVSGTGITVAILEDTSSNYIMFYDKTGSKLKVEVQTTLSGNGYPLDLDISPDGMLLTVSYVYLDQGVMQNQVVFYNFDDEGENLKDHLIASYKDFDDGMVPRVKFLDSTHAAAFGQDKVCLYSLENTVKSEVLAEIPVSDEISSIFYSEKYFGLVTQATDGTKTMSIYDLTGKKVSDAEIGMEYDTVRFSGDYVLFIKETECAVYNLNGNLKYQDALEGSIQDLLYLGGSKFIEITSQNMLELEFK